MLALGENSRTSEVGEIRVLLDSGPSEDASKELRFDIFRAQRLNAKKLEKLATSRDLSKVTVHVFGRQPTYADIFRYASDELNGRVVALANADVVLRNLHLLDADAFSEENLTALVLTVRDPTGNFQRECRRHLDRCDSSWGPAGNSYDGFVFRSPLPPTSRYDLLELFEPLPVYMNDNGAENRAKQFLAASGYDLFNPCLNNITEHWHCAPKMHHSRDRVDGGTELRAIGGGPKVPIAKNTRGLRCSSEVSV